MEQEQKIPVNIEDEMKRSYLDYAMSVIIGRALPDVRDGLKPVHRRVLWTMNELSNHYNKPYKKSARVVGDCFVEGTLVHTDRGITQIEHLSAGDSVRMPNGKFSLITKTFYNPPAPVVNVKLSNGNTLTVTPGQLFRVLKEDLTIAWERADKLAGQKVLVSSPNALDLPDLHPNPNLVAGAYCMGLLVAEGYVADRKRSRRVGITMVDKEPLEFLSSFCRSQDINTSWKEITPEQPHYKLKYTVSFNDWLAAYKACLETCQYKEVPDWILSDRRLYAPFLAGFTDGDGYIRLKDSKREAVLVSTSQLLIKQLQTMLGDSGIHCYRNFEDFSSRNYGQNRLPAYSLFITGNNVSRFCQLIVEHLKIPRKRDIALSIVSHNLRIANTETDCIPSKAVFTELSNYHLGGGWYQDINGNKFRAGIKYPGSTKIRYSTDLLEKSLSYRQIESWGILSKLEKIGSPLFERLNVLLKNYCTCDVVSVEPSKEMAATYDIQIEDTSHEFLAENTSVHNCIGKYHPHGDVAVYDTIVRLVQEFSMRVPLIDGQGNFGSVDGDAPAAMRYTEVRMAKIAEMMLADIEKETVDFHPNYDETLEEPVVLPARFPNLLVNGASGIAVGMATNIPPHNLTEIIEATVYLIQNPNAVLADIIKIVQGPDFPTAGFILGREGIRQAYETGRGSIIMRARAAIDRSVRNEAREAIVVTQIPYQVNKAKLIERIAELINEKKIEDISDLRDESDREGMRIVIELKRGAVAQVVLNNLYKLTPMQTSFGIINLAIVAGQPRVLSLVETLRLFINFRKEIVRRRTEFELRKAKARQHILQGLMRALDHLDAIIKLIRAARSVVEAREGLVNQFAFSLLQAQAILDLQLQKLTGLEREKIANELKELERRIAELEEILSNEITLKNLIIKELREVQKDFSTERRTQIIDAEADLKLEDLIPDEDMVITVTHGGYIKRTPLTNYRNQRRGGTGKKGMTTRTEDIVSHIFIASSHSYILIFSDRGQAYTLKVHEIPDVSAAGKGKAIVNLINLPGTEKVAGVLAIKEFSEDRYVVMVTRRGTIKKTQLSDFAYSRSRGILAINVDDDDELIATEISDGKKKVFIATHDGMAIYFKESDVRSMGRQAHGVRGIDLRESDYVVGVAVVTGEEKMLTIAEYGLGKRTELSEYRFQSRGGVGVINMKLTDRTGAVVAVMPVSDEDEIMIISVHGKVIRLNVGSIRETGRSAQGVKLIDTADGDYVASASLIERQVDPIPENTESK